MSPLPYKTLLSDKRIMHRKECFIMSNTKLVPAWQEVLAEFLLQKRAEAAADQTILDYQKRVTHFFKEHPESWPDNLKPAVLAHMSEKIKPATYNLRLVYLRSFFNYCVENNIIAENPLSGFKRRKTDIKFVNVETDILKQILNLPNRKTFTGLRDYALMMLALDVAIRPSEALGLLPENINLKTLTVTVPDVIAKNRETRTLPIKPQTAKAIKQLLDTRPDDWQNIPVFCSQYGTQLNEPSWYRRFKNYCRQVGLDLRAYDLRHISATEFLRGGGNMYGLKFMLGHNTLFMADKYVHFVEADIREQHNKASIINKLSPKKTCIRKIKK